MASLRRDFEVSDLQKAAAGAAVTGTIAVQARQSLVETDWLLQSARENALLMGVVGWAPLSSPDFSKVLYDLTANKLLKGLRHVVQEESAGFLDNPAFNRGVSAMFGSGLVFDLLIKVSQMWEATKFVDRHPKQSFVLDHIGKPDIVGGEWLSWRDDVRELARRPNVACKLSGMVTEANWRDWSADDLFPYFEVIVDAFSPERLMAGSDWPVLTVACSYERWWQTVDRWLEPFTSTERQQIEGGTASRIYGLANTRTEEML